MKRAELKLSPAIADRTVKQLDDEGMEAVLLHSKGRRQRLHDRSKKVHEDTSNSEEDDASPVIESPKNIELLNLIQNKKWEKLLYRLLKNPRLAHVKFTGRSTNSTSAGNFPLHEACKYDTPIDVIEALIEANEKAIMTKGNAGYLPLHCACAHGGSIKLIRLLQSLHPDATSSVDDEDCVLPLHLACKVGIVKEDVYMFLLTSYPEGSRVRDYFGRLPIDYAKNIQSDSHRKIAIECLKRASWLESAAKHAKKRTETDYQQRIRGYEQFQAQQLKLIEEVHTKEISEFEATLNFQKGEILERTKDLEDLDRRLQDKTDEFQVRVKSLERAMKMKSRKLQGEVDKAKEERAKSQVALDLKIGEASGLSEKLEQAKELIESLTQQLEQRTEDLEFILEDMETLNKHSEWLESVLESIQNLSTSVSPVAQDIQRRDEYQSIASTYASAVQSGSSRKIARSLSASISTGKSGKLLRGRIAKVSGKISPLEKRDTSLVGRVIGSPLRE
mmetsp:Transcript_19721/g.42854  ORF Transcript_19721/g.42854 Transcript_19721/m.42854 type:complete len:504 (-) Transcript_19721:48-1559(-)